MERKSEPVTEAESTRWTTARIVFVMVKVGVAYILLYHAEIGYRWGPGHLILSFTVLAERVGIVTFKFLRTVIFKLMIRLSM